MYRRHDGMTWDDAGGVAVILDPEGSVLVTLNEVGTLLWKQLEHPRDAEALTSTLVGTFPAVDATQLRVDVEQFLESLLEQGLVVSEAQGG